MASTREMASKKLLIRARFDQHSLCECFAYYIRATRELHRSENVEANVKLLSWDDCCFNAGRYPSRCVGAYAATRSSGGAFIWRSGTFLVESACVRIVSYCSC